MEAILLAVMAVWGVGLFALPVTFWRGSAWGANAKNWPGVIVMKRGLDCPGAVWAQELCEAQVRWVFLPFDVPLYLIGRLVPRLAFYERWIEIAGHAVEIEAECRLTRAPKSQLLDREARTLAAYRAFKGWSQADIAVALRREEPAASLWVSKRWQKIAAVQLKRKGQL
jgi:hypothetical protein